MILIPAVRSLQRVARGLRPRLQDLEAMSLQMRRRLEQGRQAVAWPLPRMAPAAALRRLRALQLRKLRRTVGYVGRHLPHYGRLLEAEGIRAEDIRSLDDLRRLPITHRSDLEEHPAEFISRAPGMSAAVSMHTSGTTGRPLDLYLTRDEFDYYVAVQAISGMVGGFLGPQHIFVLHAGLAYSITAQIFTAAAQKAGALVLHLDVTENLDRSLDFLFRDFSIPGKLSRVSGLFAAPGQLWALTARADQRAMAGRESGLRRIFTCGAMVSEALRERLRSFWGLPVREAYSTVETPGTGAIECDHGRLHFLDVSGLIEFLDPETREPVPPGRPGIAVITSFYPDRELMPLLRYWTQDLMIPSARTSCECGMASTQIEEILGRVDEMIVVGAQNVYPHAVGDVLTGFAELVQPPRFSVAVEERPDSQYVVVDVEHRAAIAGQARRDLERRIREDLPISRTLYVRSGSIKCDVRLVPAGSIGRPVRYKHQGPARPAPEAPSTAPRLRPRRSM